MAFLCVRTTAQIAFHKILYTPILDRERKMGVYRACMQKKLDMAEVGQLALQCSLVLFSPVSKKISEYLCRFFCADTSSYSKSMIETCIITQIV